MSLLSESMENFIMLDKTTVEDGRGGFDPAYVEGAQFDGALALKTSDLVLTADKTQGKNLYDILTPRNVVLSPNDVFKRVSDGKTFRVTSDGKDMKTPNSASLTLRKVSVEQYELGADYNG